MGETVVDKDPPDPADELQHELPELPETPWQRFLHSYWLGGILAVACAVGLLAIFGTHPFASRSVSDRISSKVGRLASCAKVGSVQSDGKQLTVYKCVVGSEKARVTQCFTISSGDVRQLSGTRELGC
jgi:hypothetical protein